MQKTEAAMILAGVQSEENREASAPTNLHVITGTVVETSENGKAKVGLDGLIFSSDNEQAIEIDTLGGLEEGDTATILLSGESGHGMLPMAIGAGGSVDRVVERIKGIEADYVKATLLEAQVAQIGFLKADSATITNLQTQTAKIENLTAEQLSAATAYIAALTASSITAASLTADVAKVHNLTADQLSAAAAYISQLTADSVTAQNISAMYGDFATVKANAAKVANLTAQELEADHATIANLDSNYAQIGLANVNTAQITNGIIQTASIVDEQVFTVSGNKATLAEIDASKINVSNLNADNITVNKINGQPVTGKSISDALTQHETDISTKVDTTTFNNTVNGLNDRIDGAIETFTGTVVPTLNNTPASSWNTTKLRNKHIGDVYYVVNANSEQNGYCYRFTKSGSTYSWQLIKDSDVTAALSRLQTAEGKITTFDSDISTLKTDTGELKTKTQSLETSLGDKVDVTTFNDLSSDVDENSATITTLSNTVSQKADSSTVTTLSNTVNQVKQTADTNKTSITNLTQTVNQKADSSTVTTLTQRTSTIEQNLSGITTRVGKTESTLETVSNPNLSPFFSMAKDDVYNASSNPNGYWKRIATNAQFTTYDMQVEHNGSGGWVHLAGNATSGNPYVRFEPMPIDTLKPSTKYTFVIDTDTISAASSINAIDLQIASGKAISDAFDPFSANMSFAAKGKTGTYYATGTTRADISDATVLSRSYLHVYGTGAFDLYIRLSLYEGEYEGPYKPYVDQSLTTRMKYAETLIDQTANNVLIKATASDTTAAQGGKHLIQSLINVAPDGVKIDASKVEIDGTAVFNAISSDVDSAITGKGYQTASQVNTAITSKGYATTTQVATAKSEAISTAATDATNKANAVQENLDNLQIGGRNLLFKTADFSESGTSTSYFIEYIVNNGKLENSVTLEEGVEYTFSADITSSREPFNLSVGAGNGAFSKDVASANNLTSGRVSVTFTPTAAQLASGNVFAFRAPRYGSQGTSFTYSVSFTKLEKGSKATDWTPAPEDVDDRIDQSVAGHGGFTILWNYENFTKANNGEGYICAIDPTTGTKSDESGWVMWNGVKRTIPKGMINPNAIHPYNTPCYVVCRLSSADATTGTNYIVSYNSGWKGGTIGAGALSEWTWAEGTDMVIGSYVEPSSEAAFIEMSVYNPPLSSKQLTTSNITAGRANATANAAAPKTAAVYVSERIYYRTTSSTKPSAPTSWVADATQNVWDAWTTKVPPLAANKDAGSIKYLYLWTCEQRKAVSGAFLGCTTVQLDENTTVIDGGNIITNSITANQIAANTLTLGNFTDAAANSIDNSKVQVGGRNLFLNSGRATLSGVANQNNSYTSALTISETIPAGTEVTVSCQIDATNLAWGSSGPKRAGVEFNAGSSKIQYIGAWAGAALSESSNVVKVLTGTWSGRISKTVTLKYDLPKGRAYGIYVQQLGSGTCVVSKPKLEVGNRATDWTPAPEDTDSYISDSVGSLAEKTEEDLKQLSTDLNGKYDALDTWKTATDQDISTIQNNIAQDKAIRDNWINIDNNGIFVGDNSSNYGVGIDSNSVDFMVGKEKVAYASAEAFVPKALRLGDYVLSGDGAYLTIDYDPQQ